MSDFWLAPGQVFDGQRLGDWGVHVVDDCIAGLGPAPADALHVPGLLSPGFVDLQVNGGGGVMVNTTPTAAGLRTIAAAHAGLGTVAIMPTVITDAPAVLAQAAEAALALRDAPGIVGLHVEGPHIALDRRGTHAARHIRPLDQITLDIVTRLRHAGVRVMITLAPEAATSGQIASLAAMGVVVSLGHSDAEAALVWPALAAGASCFTHLYNAMSPMMNRAPGMVGAAIASEAHVGIICDGIHVDDTMVGIALRARPKPDRMFLVSDAMPTVGGPPSFDLYGKTICLKDGRLVNDEGSLAGAHVTQAEGVARLVQMVGIGLEQALRMAITVPARVIGADHLATIVGRPLSDLVVLDQNLRLACMGHALVTTRAAS